VSSRGRARQRSRRGRSLVGERYDVRAERIAHGGSVVARHEGVVVFVRHAVPGERVVVEVTEGQEGDRFLRADAVEVLEPSPDRVSPPCPYAGPGLCGGCDFQHVVLPAQRDLKATVVAEQLDRLAGLSVEVLVERVPGDRDGLDWRTRVQWAVDPSGRPGLRKHRSHEVLPVEDCRIAHPDLPPPLVEEGGALAKPVSKPATIATIATIETLVSAAGERLRLLTARDGTTHADGPPVLHERAAGRDWQVTGSGFWQVHPGAADALVAAVLDGLNARPGERVLDLYAGVGLFSASLAGLVGPTGSVLAVEADAQAATDAGANLADLPGVEVLNARVDRALADLPRVDLVVLDPPRTGARSDVVASIAGLDPRAVAYVACDPAALARDVAYFAEHGYRLRSLRAYDLFPMTHHVECVAVLAR
jgi:tRNA/tmRNA/rRNA uracil-C5-methylase (TrmA/RlmC/RlmD family)